MNKLIANLREPRQGIHEDGTEELKTWEQLWEQCQEAAEALSKRGITDDQIWTLVRVYHGFPSEEAMVEHFQYDLELYMNKMRRAASAAGIYSDATE
jgi:hypothetical protein